MSGRRRQPDDLSSADKKKLADAYRDVYSGHGDEQEQTTSDYAKQVSDLGETYVEGLDATNADYNVAMRGANDARTQASQAAFNKYQEAREKGYTDVYDMIREANKDILDARREAQAEVKADQRAARWTGLTELASAVANLATTGFE